MRRFWLAIILATFASGACGDIAKFDPPDKRLDKHVTLEVDHIKLEDVAKSLSEQSGVTIKAGTGKRDWKVRQQKVTIRAKDVTAGRMIDELTKLLGFYVSREGKAGEWTYVIWQDKKGRDLEAEMLHAAEAETARKAAEIRKSTADAAKKALKMTPEDAMKLRDKDPFTAYLGGTKSGRAFAQMLSSMDSFLPGYADGNRSFAPISGLPRAMRRSVSDILSSGMAKAFGDVGSGNQSLSPDQIGYVPLTDTGDRQSALMGINGLVLVTGMPKDGTPNPSRGPFGPGRPMIMFPIMRPDSPFGKLVGEAMLGLEEGMSPEEVGTQLQQKVEDKQFLGQAMAKESETEKKPPTDPELTREVELKEVPGPKDITAVASSDSKPEDQGKTIAEISNALGMPVLLESFDRLMPLSMFLTPGKQPVYKIMIGLEKAGYSWKMEDKSLRIRAANWASRRAQEIPDSFIAYYVDLLDKQGELTMDDLAGIANGLTNEQLQTLSAKPDLNFAVGPIRGGIGGTRDILRLYGSLTPHQKEALESEAGLQFGDLNNTQWQQMSRIISDTLNAYTGIAGGSIQLVPLSEKEIQAKRRSRIFRLTVQLGTEREPRKADISVYIQSKESVTAVRESRRKAKEDAEKAKEQAQSAPPAAPAQTQAAPAQ